MCRVERISYKKNSTSKILTHLSSSFSLFLYLFFLFLSPLNILISSPTSDSGAPFPFIV